MRPLMEAAYGDLAEGRIPIVVAPTGYGKTRASPEIYERARRDGVASGLVHVAPLRSLVRRIYLDIFREHGGAYQMHDPRPAGDKSPYLLRPLVVTTLDSFTYNMYRIPVLESLKIRKGLSYGHYYPVYTGVLSSVIVFDEAHLYLSEEASQGMILETIEALAGYLAESGAALMIETATMMPSTVAGIANRLRRARREVVVRLPSCPAGPRSRYEESLQKALGAGSGVRIERVPDDDLAAAGGEIRWDTRIYRSWGEALARARELSKEGRVLIVANTVSRAISIMEELGGDALLIHGRLSTRDREEAEEALAGRSGPRIIVSTQVVEAGVDVNSIAVITEAAPIESLVQRAGRACRRGEELQYCRENGAHIGIVRIERGEPSKVYPEWLVKRSLEAVQSRLERGVAIDWRAPCPARGVEPYTSLIAEVDSGRAAAERGSSRRTGIHVSLLETFLGKDGVPDFLEDLARMRGWCGLVRNTIMMPIVLDEAGDYVVASLQWALARADKILETDPRTGAPLLVGIPIEGGGRPLEGPAAETWSYYNEKRSGGTPRDRDCFTLLSRLAADQRRIASQAGLGVARYLWGFRARPGSYVSRKGFQVDMPGGGLE